MNYFDYKKYVDILSKIIDTKVNDIQIITSHDLIHYDQKLINSIFNDLVEYDYASWGNDHNSIINFKYPEIENFAQTLIVEYIDTNEPGASLAFLTTLKNTPVENIDWNDQLLQQPIQCLSSFKLINSDATSKYKITEFGKLILSRLE